MADPWLYDLFVQGSNWFTTNFSVLGSGLAKQNAFAFWGLLVGIYFFIILEIISKYLVLSPKETFFIPLALLLLTCAITTPYLPGQFPFKSFLHVIFAFLSAVCLSLFPDPGSLEAAPRTARPVLALFPGAGADYFLRSYPAYCRRDRKQRLGNLFTLSATLFCRRLERKLHSFNLSSCDKHREMRKQPC